MKNLYVKDIIKLCNGTLLNGNPNLLLENFCTDTRKIKKNDIYVAIKGETFDGNKFYQEAIKKGASICILDNVEDNYDYQNATVILVDNTITCLQQLATYKRSLYNIPVIAITGSVGKTSTKDIVASVIEQKYKTCKTIGNYNNHIGVPLTILSLKDEEALVVEMGMNHLGEISVLSNIAKPTISIITNVGTAHIGNLGSRENILKAKLEILDGMIGNTCIFNADNDMLSSVIDDYFALDYSIDTEGSVWQATNIKEDIFSSKFDIKNGPKDIIVNVGGKSFVYNSLVAYAVGEILDIDENSIKKGISNFSLSSGRLEKKITKEGITIIDDTYNANYDSMKSSIELLGKVKDKRKIAILGDMLELGDYTKELHTKIGEIINNNVDILITIGTYSINIETKAIELGMNKNNCYHFNKQSDCYDFVKNLLTNNDIVLLKGSHSIHLDKIVEYLMK